MEVDRRRSRAALRVRYTDEEQLRNEMVASRIENLLGS